MSEKTKATIKDKLYEGWFQSGGFPFVFWTNDGKILLSDEEKDWFILEIGKSYDLILKPTKRGTGYIIVHEEESE